MARSTDFVHVAMSKISRTSTWPNPESFDNASLVSWAADVVGVALPDTSIEQYKLCVSKGTMLPVDLAEYIRGALLFEGATGARLVVISLGNGEVIEARGTTYAIADFDAPGHPWTAAALIPGMDY